MPDGLERRLELLAREVEFPATPDLGPAVLERLGPLARARPRWVPARRSLALALALLALMAAAAAAVPAVRDAVGDLFGLGGATVERVPALPAAPGGLDLGRPTDLAGAARETRFRVLLPRDRALGPPDQVRLRGRGPLGQVTLLYRPAARLPELRATGVGLLLTEFRGDLDSDAVQKFIGPHTGTRRLRVGSAPAFWVEGPHTFAYRDSRGKVRIEERRLAGNTLLWRRGRLLLRLESGLPLDRALEIARTVG